MKRKMLCFLLSAIMLVGLLPVTALADDTITISDAAVEMLKVFEGFSARAYKDYSQYSIGYGTSCSEQDYLNGLTITEEEAERRLRERVAISASALADFAQENNLSLNQGQIDALLLFTYNVGEGWMRYNANDPSRFRQSVIDGDTGNKFVYNMALWSTAGGAPHVGLLTRRLCEADLYLNGNYNYTKIAPDHYNYVLLDAQGGEVEDRMQGYISNEEVLIKPVPDQREGYRFLGWYTKSIGGQWVTSLTGSHDGMTLYAHWQYGEGSLDGKGNILGSTVDYDCVAGNCAKLDKYAQPSEGAEVTGTLAASDIISITADYVDDCGIKWGKLSSGEWVMLGTAVPNQTVTSEPIVVVTVTNTYINVRQNAGASSALTGKVYQGDKLTIFRTKMVNDEMWGKFSGGWVCLKYTDYSLVVENESGTSAPVIATGYVVCNNYLNVRQDAGVNSALVGRLLPGDEVKITEFKTVGTAKWARVQQGWVSMDYIQLVEEEEIPEDSTDPDVPAAPENPDQPETPSQPETPEEDVLYTGTVINADALRVRSAPGTKNPQVGYLTRGQKVKILEEKEVDDAPWGRISSGWICLLYVQADPTEEDLKNAATGVVTSNMNLNVRSAPGAHNTLLTSLPTGTEVTVYQQTMVNGVAWGRIDQGWVCMLYVQLVENTEPEQPSEPDTPVDPENPVDPETPVEPETPEQTVICNGSVILTNALRVRTGAGTHYAEVTRLTMGTKVKIYEIALVNNVKWGRIDNGWICLNYVKLEPITGVQAKPLSGTVTVTNTPLKIRAAAGVQNKLLGQLTNGTKVTVYEITMVNNVAWGRIDQGWVCLNYVILEMPAPDPEPEEPTEPEDPIEETEEPSEEPEEPTEETEGPAEEPENPTEESTEPEKETVLYTGKVILTNDLRIRSAAGANNPQVGSMKLGEKVELYEITLVNGIKWGRVEKGWICLSYFQVDPTADNAKNTLVGTVTVNTTPLNIRESAGVQHKLVGQLANGTKITITEITIVNKVAWGRIEQGWVCLDYVKLDIPEPSQNQEQPDVDTDLEALCGVWAMDLNLGSELAESLLAGLEFYEEEIALVELDTLSCVACIEFNDDNTYSCYIDIDGTKANVTEFFEGVFSDLYAGRENLSEAYERDMSTMTEEEFYQFYADMFSAEDIDTLISALVEYSFDYETLSQTLEKGTFRIEDNQIFVTPEGETEEDVMGYAIKGNTLTLTYTDGEEVYTKK